MSLQLAPPRTRGWLAEAVGAVELLCGICRATPQAARAPSLAALVVVAAAATGDCDASAWGSCASSWDGDIGNIPFAAGSSWAFAAGTPLSELLRGLPREDSSLPEPLEAAVREVRENGVTFLRGPARGGLKPKETKLVQKSTMAFFQKAVSRIGEELQKDPQLVIRYLDVVARRSHRLDTKWWDGWDKKKFGFLHDPKGIRHQIMQHILGTSEYRLTHAGALMAKPAVEPLPNNVNQAWHRDSPNESSLAAEMENYAAVIYIPLIDMTEDSGITEFLIGSHQDVENCDILEQEPPSADRLVSTAGMSAGDVVLFDSRTCHRGMLHTDPARGLGELGIRPVIALHWGVHDWVDPEDSNNWGTHYLVKDVKRPRGK